MSASLAVLSGTLVGLMLGLIGGGGSILATPLLLYVVGITQPHIAIGTGALAVAVSAFASFAQHWRAGNVRWGNAVAFAAVGVVGAFAGSTLGKAFDGQKLLLLFAVLMIVVGVLMLRAAKTERKSGGVLDGLKADSPACTSKLAAVAFMAGALSGFFGIGGGFLVVPGLLFATGMPLINAIGTSLFAVGAFGLATAINYALSGLVDWAVAAEYIGGGLLGGWTGMRLACSLAAYKGVLNRVFAAVIFMVAGYMIYRTVGVWLPDAAAQGVKR
ncbi:sulfite exporter TauE/SafE family protein [Lichenifustis flavocetrariae]|uniref:Probable membrane transporter protein n=1 Tax=Lichenifustis flavocetrariae TaxID=2949735 RepID=A0AA41YZ76_9HYPH|nr:sulfite exporter TauE/SafE family protein [Lichenifustis flavocetrariae]MCW6511279.1 sulfite exporter TauE/SafE family protein [Lichenifustis flavocetrariae]